jgi:Tfp pilus assembly protein PilF
MEEATKAAAHGPMSPQIQMLRGEMAERDGDHAKAIGYVESALEALPGNARGWALLGRACHFTGRINDAAEAYGRAVELAPRNLHYRATYGLVLGMSGDLDGGLAELEKVVETPGYGEPDGWVNLGWVRRTRNEPAESIAAYRKALEIDPKQAQAALGLGWALTRTKEYDEAIVWTLKAVDLDPSLAPDAYWGVTLAYIYKGDLEKAREFEKKTIAAGRSDPRLAEYIAQLAAGIKDRAEQMAQWEKEQEQAAERARQVEAARNAVRSRNPATRAAGARRLVNDTGGGVDTLIYLIQTDPDWTVRIAAAETLGAFGPAARKAVPHIEGILRQDPYIAPVVDPSDEQINHEMADADLRRALSQALHKIQQR